MPLTEQQLRDIINRHYTEASGGVVVKPASRLSRGEATEVDFYIMKVDLVASTIQLSKMQNRSYVKVAHTYLSTLDAIARSYGADGDQTEYAGDSVMSYFPSSSVSADSVIMAACFSRVAAKKLRFLDATLRKIPFLTRIILHHGTLLVSNIGPWGESKKLAIGIPLHKVGHLEKKVFPGRSIVTIEFGRKVERRFRARFLERVYDEQEVTVELPPLPPPPLTPSNSLGGLLGSPQNVFANPKPIGGLFGAIQQQQKPAPRYKTEIRKTLKWYTARWSNLEKHLGLSIDKY